MDYYSLMWVLSFALVPILLASVAAVVIWNVHDVDGNKQPYLDSKAHRRDICGYELSVKDAVTELRWRDPLPGLDQCRLEVLPLPDGRVMFRSGVPEFDMHFAVREASPETIANLWANGHRLDPAMQFLERRLGKVEDVLIHGGTIRFRGKYGGISQKLLPEMIRFANAFYDAAAFPPLQPKPPEQRNGGDYRSPPAMDGQSWLVERIVGEPLGPVPGEQVVRWLYAGAVGPTTRIAAADTREWKPLGDVSAFRDVFARAAPAPAKAIKSASGARQWLFWRLRKPYGDIVLAISATLALAGSQWLAQGKTTWDLAIESVAWPEVRGDVVESRKSCSTSGSGSNRTTSCSHVLRYVYEVQGKQYEAYLLRFGSDGTSIEERVTQYPKGKKVRVHYRAHEPSVAVLEPGPENLQPLIAAYIPLVPGLGVTMLLGSWQLSLLLGRLRRAWLRRRLLFAVGSR